jgi:hypothetical protein
MPAKSLRLYARARHGALNEKFIDFGRQRPAVQRRQIREQFEIERDVAVTPDRSPPSRGRVRINTIVIEPGPAGVGADPNPWTGAYFSGIPIELEAIPESGCRFAGWTLGGAEDGRSPGRPPLPDAARAEITLTLTNDVSLTAHFAADLQSVQAGKP